MNESPAAVLYGLGEFSLHEPIGFNVTGTIRADYSAGNTHTGFWLQMAPLMQHEDGKYMSRDWQEFASATFADGSGAGSAPWLEIIFAPDQDGDQVPDEIDNCPGIANPDQLDTDGNGIGDTCEPTLAELTGMQSLRLPGCAIVLWQTAIEPDNAGFHLYRAPLAEGPFVRITPQLIAARGDSGTGAAYAWIDPFPGWHTGLWYQLEDVARDGVRTRHPPVKAFSALLAALAAH